MKIIKSDYRYKFHREGYHHILEFRMHNSEDIRKYYAIADGLKSSYGDHDGSDWSTGRLHKTYNHNYRLEYNRKMKRRRIYLRNEQDLTFLILKGQV